MESKHEIFPVSVTGKLW